MLQRNGPWQTVGATQDRPAREPGPLYSINLITIACYFMLRKIEASLMLYHKVFIDHDRKEVTIKLP